MSAETCEWCGLPLHGAIYCRRPSCVVEPSHRVDRWLSRGTLGLCAFTAVGIVVQILRGWP